MGALDMIRISLSITIFSILNLGCGAETVGADHTDYLAQAVIDSGVTADAGILMDRGVINENEPFIGHWAHRQVLAGFTDLPVFGSTYSETVGTFRLEIIPDEDGVIVLMDTCSVVLRRAIDAVTTTIPQQFIDALPISIRPAKIQGNELDIRYFIELNGTRLNNPETDALPTDPDDPRVYDQDGDGQPGMTVLVEGIIDGEVRLVQRTRTRHHGVLENEVIRGTVQWEADEEILGADNPALVQGATVEPHSQVEKSWFVARPINANSTCDDVLSGEDELFPEDTGLNTEDGI